MTYVASRVEMNLQTTARVLHRGAVNTREDRE